MRRRRGQPPGFVARTTEGRSQRESNAAGARDDTDTRASRGSTNEANSVPETVSRRASVRSVAETGSPGFVPWTTGGRSQRELQPWEHADVAGSIASRDGASGATSASVTTLGRTSVRGVVDAGVSPGSWRGRSEAARDGRLQTREPASTAMSACLAAG